MSLASCSSLIYHCWVSPTLVISSFSFTTLLPLPLPNFHPNPSTNPLTSPIISTTPVSHFPLLLFPKTISYLPAPFYAPLLANPILI